jgi:hypothetical protein
MKKVISYSLWGDDTRYTIGAIHNSILAKYYYPGWISRFYCGNNVPNHIINQLSSFNHNEVIMVDDSPNWTGMFWRFYAAADADIMISRDADARLSSREACAVSSWLATDKSFHIMRDHPYHARPIMGGMWGCRNGILSNITDLIKQFDKSDRYEIDQDFLGKIIYPRVANSACVHDPFYQKLPFPQECEARIPCFHIGQAYDETGVVLGVEEYGPMSYTNFILEKDNINLYEDIL